MANNREDVDGWRGSLWRKAAWLGTAGLLLLPLIAMQFTDEVNWTLSDFVFAAILLFGSLGAFELATRVSGNMAYRGGAGVGVVAVLLLSWSNAAVGITDGDADFLIFWGVPAVVIAGAIIARFRPGGLALAMISAALTLTLITVLALVTGIVAPHNSAFMILGITGFFDVMFVTSGWLFLRAAKESNAPGAKSPA